MQSWTVKLDFSPVLGHALTQTSGGFYIIPLIYRLFDTDETKQRL